MTEACNGCPFVESSDETLAEQRDYVDQGGWVPCRLTLASRRSDTVAGRQEQMRQEMECVGARIWRRDRRRPAAATE